jgi:hypothetical protein
MGVVTWSVGLGPAWVLDLTSGAATGRAYLITGFPSDGPPGDDVSPVLTAALGDAMAAALQSAAAELDGITGAVLSAVEFSGLVATNPSTQFLFPAADWALYASAISQIDGDGEPLVSGGWYTGSWAWLVLPLPAAGTLTHVQADSLASSLSAAFNAAEGITGVSFAQAAFTPATA